MTHPALPRLLLLLAASVLLGACAPVEPWQRGTLAKPQMAVDAVPLQAAWRAHVHSSREAAPAAVAAEGGGCGCY